MTKKTVRKLRAPKRAATTKAMAVTRSVAMLKSVEVDNAAELRSWRAKSPLKLWRTAKGLTLSAMADALGMSRNRMWQLEAGVIIHSVYGLQHAKPSLGLLFEMDRVFGDYPSIRAMRLWWGMVPSVRANIRIEDGRGKKVNAAKLLKSAPKSMEALDELDRGG